MIKGLAHLAWERSLVWILDYSIKVANYLLLQLSYWLYFDFLFKLLILEIVLNLFHLVCPLEMISA